MNRKLLYTSGIAILLERLKSAQPALILLDLQLPGVDGFPNSLLAMTAYARPA